MSENQVSICPNCNQQNPSDYHYCLECGQKNRPLKVTFFQFFGDLINLILNVDNKFWKTFKYIFWPGKLTQLFYEGKRKSFYHPLRIYLLAIILFFAVLSLLKLDKIINTNEGLYSLGERFERQNAVYEQKEHLISTLDSLREVYGSQPEISLIDTLKKELFIVFEGDTSYVNEVVTDDTTNITLLTTEIEFVSADIYTKDVDEVADELGLTNFFDRLFFKQFVKGTRDLGSLNNFLFANLTWLFVAIIPVFALILKLFYIRRKRYYMEHFVFLLHLFTAMIVAASVLLAIFVPMKQTAYMSIPLGIIGIIFPFMAFKKYYQQGYIKTFFKFISIGVFFTIGFFITFSIFLVITAALF